MGPDAIKATRSIMGPSRPFVFWDKNLTGLPHLPSKDMIFQLANQISIYIYINYCPLFFWSCKFLYFGRHIAFCPVSMWKWHVNESRGKAMLNLELEAYFKETITVLMTPPPFVHPFSSVR